MVQGLRCVVVFGQHLRSNPGHHDDGWMVTTHHLLPAFLVSIEDRDYVAANAFHTCTKKNAASATASMKCH